MTYQKLYDQTLTIKCLLDQADQTDREEWIGKLQTLLDERGKVLERLSKVSGAEEKATGEQIVAMNRQINAALQLLKQEIVNDMNQFRHRKRSVGRYRNPYQGPSKDGMFLDKRE